MPCWLVWVVCNAGGVLGALMPCLGKQESDGPVRRAKATTSLASSNTACELFERPLLLLLRPPVCVWVVYHKKRGLPLSPGKICLRASTWSKQKDEQHAPLWTPNAAHWLATMPSHLTQGLLSTCAVCMAWW